MKKKSLWDKAKKVVKRTGNDLRKSPVGRAARGKSTRGYF